MCPSRLRTCPETPNCVSSLAEDPGHRVEPLGFSGSPAIAQQRLKAILAAWPRTRIVAEAPGYLHAECRSRIFRFVDDLEMEVGEGLVHVRSASRVGRSDLGVNRRRVETLRRAFTAELSASSASAPGSSDQE